MRESIASAIAQLESFQRTVDDALELPRDAAEFVYALLLATKPRLAVEIGTSYGYSGLWIAAALERSGGRLITIDRDPRKSEAARTVFVAAGLSKRVEIQTGRASDRLARITGTVDFVLNDADKASCRTYAETLLPRLSPGAVFLTDNTRTHAGELAEFLEWIRRCGAFHSVSVPIGNGMEMSVRLCE